VDTVEGSRSVLLTGGLRQDSVAGTSLPGKEASELEQVIKGDRGEGTNERGEPATAPMTMATRWCVSLLVLLLVVWLPEAHAGSGGDTWLPVTPEDLALKDNPKSPGADAMILYRESNINAGNSTVNEYYRIKIFTAQGERQGDVSIVYDANSTSIKDIRARTIRPSGETVDFEGSVFDQTMIRGGKLNLMQKTFSLPDVEPGSIVEYRYVRQYQRGSTLDLTWIVQGPLYTHMARFSIIPVKSANTPAMYYRALNLPEGSIPQQQGDGSYTLEVHDLPGIEKEAYMPPENVLQGRVEFFFRNPMITGTGSADQFWKLMGSTMSGPLDTFVNKTGPLASEVARVCAPGDSEETKLRKLYARTQEIRNLSAEGTRTKKEEEQEKLRPITNVEDVLKYRYGNRGQINLLLVGLARQAGFEAAMVYLASRNRTFFVPDLQDIRQLSSQAVWVRAGGKEYFLDPGSRYYPFGVLPWAETATKGLRVEGAKSEVVSTPLPPASDARVQRRIEVKMDEEGSLAGKIQVDFGGQEGSDIREEQHAEDEAGRRKRLEDSIKGWLPPESKFEITKVSNWDDLTQPIRVEGTIKVDGLTAQTEHRIIMPSTLFEVPQARAFQPAKRANPVYFPYPFEVVDDVKISIPAGLRVEVLPQQQRLSAGELSYEISADQDGGAVEIKRRLTVNTIAVPVQQYALLRTFFFTVKSYDDERMVLQRTDVAGKN
jgi:hypothetical protein